MWLKFFFTSSILSPGITFQWFSRMFSDLGWLEVGDSNWSSFPPPNQPTKQSLRVVSPTFFSQSNRWNLRWKLSGTLNGSIRWFMLVGKFYQKIIFSKPLITQQICNVCKLEDTRRDWNSVVLGHYPGAFVLTAAEIVRTQEGVGTKNVRLTQNSVDFNL